MFQDLWSELKGYIPGLSPFLAMKFINRAWRDILDADDWSFLEGQAILQVPKLVNTGTISWTQFSNQITGDLAASATWSPLLLGTPPFIASTNSAGQPLIGTGYQIRSLNGPLYSVIASDGLLPNMTLTVDRPISEPSKSGVTYQAFRAYFGAPSTDFLSYTSVTNVAQGYTITGRRLSGSQAQLNTIDPQRSSTEDMYFMFSLFTDASGMPVKEAWPIPVNQQGYIAIYKRRGTDLTPASDLPASFPDMCLLERARMYAYLWKSTQRRDPADGTDWALAAKIARQAYSGPEPGGEGLLAVAKKKDTSLRTPPPIIRRGPMQSFPFSSQFVANHDVTRMLSGFPAFFNNY